MGVRILLVDDHPAMCAGLRLLVEREAGLEVVGHAHDGKSALLQFVQLSPELVVMDIDLGGSDGIVLAEALLAHEPSTKIIAFSGLKPSDHIDRALKAGIKGYLVKTTAEAELLQAIRTVLAGRIYLCVDAVEAMVEGYRKLLSGSPASKVTLSERELSVLRLTAQGLRVKDIARELSIGVKTVDTHRSKLMTKLGCANAAELTRWAIREGIIMP
jgi:DNA-binding NarL/FixJ family response regulator